MKTISLLIVAIFVGIGRSLLFVVKNRGLLIVLIIVVGAVTIFTQISSGNNPLANMPSYQVVAPDRTLAPFVLPTNSRVYYVANSREIPGGILLTDYYSYDADTWKRSTDPLPLLNEYYGDLSLRQR